MAGAETYALRSRSGFRAESLRIQIGFYGGFEGLYGDYLGVINIQ